MIGAISNPTKKVTVDYNSDVLKGAIQNLNKVHSRYKVTSENLMFNQITLETTEFLSLGVFIDINLNPISETRTEITIEVRRKLGAFDSWVEVQNANEHIQRIIDGISKALVTPVGELKQVEEIPTWSYALGFIIAIVILSMIH